MIEILKAFDPVTMLEIPDYKNQRIVKLKYLEFIRKDLEEKHNVKKVLFIFKEIEKDTE